MDDAYAAYCLDEAVAVFGSNIESRLQDLKTDNVAVLERALNRMLGDGEITAGQYADPVAMGMV